MKPKVAFYWCASCGGCEEGVLDLAEGVLDVVAAVDIVFWPVALDFKEKDVEAMEDGSITVSFINGAVRTDHQLEMARLMRRKSKLVVGFGACAQLGGIPGLANLSTAAEILREAYGDTVQPKASCQDEGHTLTLPTLFDSVYALERAIPVDYYIPGCPPAPKTIADALAILLSGNLPPKGTVLAPDHAMCQDCLRKDTHPDELKLEKFYRVQDVVLDTEKCILAQGVPCLGPATRAGCGARCTAGNMPCTGCYGPTSHVREYGAKALSAMASVADGQEEADIDRALDGLVDPVGTFYRYSLPASFLERKHSE